MLLPAFFFHRNRQQQSPFILINSVSKVVIMIFLSVLEMITIETSSGEKKTVTFQKSASKVITGIMTLLKKQ